MQYVPVTFLFQFIVRGLVFYSSFPPCLGLRKTVGCRLFFCFVYLPFPYEYVPIKQCHFLLSHVRIVSTQAKLPRLQSDVPINLSIYIRYLVPYLPIQYMYYSSHQSPWDDTQHTENLLLDVPIQSNPIQASSRLVVETPAVPARRVEGVGG